MILQKGCALTAIVSYVLLASHNVQAQTYKWQPVAPGVVRREFRSLGSKLTNNRVWLYLPANVKPKQKLRTVLIAAAGSDMFNGVPLTDRDMPEHTPYAKAGFAVIAYETDGTLTGDDELSVVHAVQGFVASQGGLSNARAALDSILPYAPFVDRKHIYAVGHSSAATLAIALSTSEPRIAGCVAYAPQPDIPGYLGANAVSLNRQVPGFARLISDISPQQNVSQLHNPLFLFHAKDDSVVSRNDIFSYVSALRRAHVDFTFQEVPTGNHYDSMIREGIPAGIAWIKKQP